MGDTSHVAGATSKIITVEGFTQSDGSEYTGGAWNTATITATYTRDGGTATSITLATMTAGTWATGGFVHRGNGVYELGLPNAALVTGADGVEIKVAGISGKYFKPARVEILGVDPRSATPPAATLSGDLTSTMKTSVRTEVVGALITDTYAEPSAVPAATSSLKDKLGYLFTKTRNKVTQTATTQLLRNDSDAATIGTTTVSDDGTVFTKSEDV